MEVPIPTVVDALRKRGSVPVLLNAAPLSHDFPWGEPALNYLVVNEHEAAELLGRAPGPANRPWAAAVRPRLRRLRIERLIVTRGKLATYCVTADWASAIPTMAVRPVDTVGAGDAFTGTLAAHLTLGRSLPEALVLANTAGALATQAIGAQESMPTLQATLTRHRNKHGRKRIQAGKLGAGKLGEGLV
jgi:ribokinase